MTTATRPYPIEELWVDTVGVTSVEADWDAIGGEYHEGFTSYEAPDCDVCGEYGSFSDDERVWVCDNAACENHGGEIEDNGEGPMMNYYYPLPDLRRMGDDPYAAATAIRDLPLCVVEFNGSYALALTGGGMDLSWEICEAFTRLGYLPPLHFCDLPRLAGHSTNQYVVSACLRSCEVAERQAQSTRERLTAFSTEEDS